VPLDPTLVSVLRTHRKIQLEERLAWGEAWTDSGYVFVREDGLPYHPEYYSDAFDRHVKRSTLPRIRLHDTRHTAATLSLQALSRPRLSPSGWVTPPCRSLRTSTATPSPRCKKRPERSSRTSSSAL
jgi:integrase